MKVNYKTILAGELAESYGVLPDSVFHFSMIDATNFCCSEMESFFKNKDISKYIDREKPYGKESRKGLHINLLIGGMLIKFCPFCGQFIEFNESKRVTYGNKHLSKNIRYDYDEIDVKPESGEK